MTCASGQHRNIASLHNQFVSLLSTQHQPRGTAGEPEHFMCSRVIVMEIVYSVSPLRRPAIACKQLLEPRRRIRILRVLDAAIKQHGRMFVVRHPAVAREAQYLRISGSSISTSSDSPIGRILRSGRRPKTHSPEHTHESSSVHEGNPFWRRTVHNQTDVEWRLVYTSADLKLLATSLFYMIQASSPIEGVFFSTFKDRLVLDIQLSAMRNELGNQIAQARVDIIDRFKIAPPPVLPVTF